MFYEHRWFHRAIGNLALLIASAPALTRQGAAQEMTPSAAVSFDVVVIKPSPPGDTKWRMQFDPGTMTIQNRSVRDLIKFAYGLNSDSQLLNAPKWISSESFDIVGKEDEVLGKTLETCPLAQRQRLMRQLVRSVLEQRFNIQVEERKAEIPVFGLVVSKSGAKTAVANPGDGRTFRGLRGPAGSIDGRGASMQLLADRLSRAPEVAGRLVLDKTGMAGDFDWSLRWTPDAGLDGSSAGAAESGPSLFTALQEQLGLKLEQQKALVPAVFLVRIAQPSEN